MYKLVEPGQSLTWFSLICCCLFAIYFCYSLPIALNPQGCKGDFKVMTKTEIQSSIKNNKNKLCHHRWFLSRTIMQIKSVKSYSQSNQAIQ